MIRVTSPFAFVSGALDRAAHLRSDAGPTGDVHARTLVFWRGKLLTADGGSPLWVPLDHPALKDAVEPPVFLGLRPAGPAFASELTLWSPPEDATTIGEFTDRSQQIHPAWPEARLVELRAMMPELDALDGECAAVGRALLGWHASHRFCARCGQPSQPDTAGWVRKCPQCGAQHFPRTDPVVIMAITHGDRLLLGRGTTWPDRMYSLLAGFVEPGETIESAVRREVREESHIQVGAVRYVTCQPWPFPMSLMFGCQGEALSREITVDPMELADARWLSRSEVQSMLAGTHPDIAPSRPGTIANALITAWAENRLDDADSWRN